MPNDRIEFPAWFDRGVDAFGRRMTVSAETLRVERLQLLQQAVEALEAGQVPDAATGRWIVAAMARRQCPVTR